MSTWIVNQRNGAKTGPFLNYVQAAEFRQKVLRPRLAADAPCPFAIRDDDTTQLGLPVCVIPGCAQLVGEWGETCDTCLTEFGSLLRPTGHPPLTEGEIAQRDRDVAHVYSQRSQTMRAGG